MQQCVALRAATSSPSPVLRRRRTTVVWPRLRSPLPSSAMMSQPESRPASNSSARASMSPGIRTYRPVHIHSLVHLECVTLTLKYRQQNCKCAKCDCCKWGPNYIYVISGLLCFFCSTCSSSQRSSIGMRSSACSQKSGSEVPSGSPAARGTVCISNCTAEFICMTAHYRCGT